MKEWWLDVGAGIDVAPLSIPNGVGLPQFDVSKGKLTDVVDSRRRGRS